MIKFAGAVGVMKDGANIMLIPSDESIDLKNSKREAMLVKKGLAIYVKKEKKPKPPQSKPDNKDKDEEEDEMDDYLEDETADGEEEGEDDGEEKPSIDPKNPV